MDKKNRDRGENWTAEEKEIFIDLMKSSAYIIECKNTDTNTNKKKQTEWLTVQTKFQELTGKLRGVPQLKGFWRRTRMVAKKSVFQHRRALNATGGGEKPPSPSQEVQQIVAMCPTDFIMEENELDSDGIFYKNEMIHNYAQKDTAGPSQQEDTTTRTNTHLFDIEDAAQGEGISFEEIIIDENVHNTGNMSTPQSPHQSQNTIHRTRNCRKTEKSHKTTIVQSNIDIKEKTFKLLEQEYDLKLRYQRQELHHQELRHKLEIEVLLIEKEKKEWELKLIKK